MEKNWNASERERDQEYRDILVQAGSVGVLVLLDNGDDECDELGPKVQILDAWPLLLRRHGSLFGLKKQSHAETPVWNCTLLHHKSFQVMTYIFGYTAHIKPPITGLIRKQTVCGNCHSRAHNVNLYTFFFFFPPIKRLKKSSLHCLWIFAAQTAP